ALIRQIRLHRLPERRLVHGAVEEHLSALALPLFLTVARQDRCLEPGLLSRTQGRALRLATLGPPGPAPRNRAPQKEQIPRRVRADDLEIPHRVARVAHVPRELLPLDHPRRVRPRTQRPRVARHRMAVRARAPAEAEPLHNALEPPTL